MKIVNLSDNISQACDLRFAANWQDDGFGNLLEACGAYHHEHALEKVPPNMAKSNLHAMNCFFEDDWYRGDFVPLHSVEVSPGLWSQRGGDVRDMSDYPGFNGYKGKTNA